METSKIYTKAGDFGYTSNALGEKISKADLRLELQGSIDEVNAGVGYLRALVMEAVNRHIHRELVKELLEQVDDQLKEIQYALFRIGGDITSGFTRNYCEAKDLAFLEKAIDDMTDDTGSLSSFIYYSGTPASAYAQVVRSVTRRAERAFVRAILERYYENVNYPTDYQFMNRLADYFFQLGRYINHVEGQTEEVMKLR